MIDMTGDLDAFLESCEASITAGGSSDALHIEDDFLLPLFELADSQYEPQPTTQSTKQEAAKAESQTLKRCGFARGNASLGLVLSNSGFCSVGFGADSADLCAPLSSKRERKREADREFRRRKRDKIERLTVSHAALLRESQELKRQIRELTALIPADALLMCKSLPAAVQQQAAQQAQAAVATAPHMHLHHQLVTNLLNVFNGGAMEQMQNFIEHVRAVAFFFFCFCFLFPWEIAAARR